MPVSSAVSEPTELKHACALLLAGPEDCEEVRRLSRLLEFFGIPEMRAGLAAAEQMDLAHFAGEFCVLTSAGQFPALIGANGELPAWALRARSVFVYGLRDDANGAQIVKSLLGAGAAIVASPDGSSNLKVTADDVELSGPLSGLEVAVDRAGRVAIQAEAPGCTPLLSDECGSYFVKLTCEGRQIYLSTCNTFIDLDEKLSGYFDVKTSFLESAPIVMYLRHAFGDACWHSESVRACLTIDDATLTDRYGFLNYKEAVNMMDEDGFTAAIAYIPWNWRRARRRAAELFRRRADRLSLCFHGCDHTANEFSSQDTPVLNWRVKTALDRMRGLARRYSLPVETIMIFPTGRFSWEACSVLKSSGFLAAVNTEVAPPRPLQTKTTIADAWNVANARYASFPIYSRRYIWHGLENFAFDALLGKPCLLVGHHEVFKDGARDLRAFIARLNQLPIELQWTSLGEVLRHAHRTRFLNSNTTEIEIFANAAVIENKSSMPREYRIIKQEQDPDSVEAVHIAERPIEYAYNGIHLTSSLQLDPGQSVQVGVTYRDPMKAGARKQGLRYRLRVRARRLLAELRDNHLSRNPALERGAKRLRTLIGK